MKLCAWWDTAKACIHDISIRYGQCRTKTRSAKRHHLQKCFETYRKEIDEGNMGNLGRLSSVEEELQQLDQAKLEGAQIRARVKWREEGEKPIAVLSLSRERATENCGSDRTMRLKQSLL